MPSGFRASKRVTRWSWASTNSPPPNPRPLTTGEDAIMVSDPDAEADQIARLNEWRASRDEAAVQAALADFARRRPRWAQRDGAVDCCRESGGHHGRMGRNRPRGFWPVSRPDRGGARAVPTAPKDWRMCAKLSDAVSAKLGRKLKFVVGKPGLDGHSNGAEQIAARARDCGMEIAYEGIRLTPAEIVAAVRDEDAHVVGLSILSGSHIPADGRSDGADAR